MTMRSTWTRVAAAVAGAVALVLTSQSAALAGDVGGLLGGGGG
jgi:hypothetical protein